MRIVLIILFSLFLNVVSYAQSNEQKATDSLKTEFQGKVGYSQSTGNVELQNITTKAKLKLSKGKNEMVLTLATQHVSVSGNTVRAMRDYSLFDMYQVSPKMGLYGKGTYFENRFIGFDYLWKFGAGIVNSWVNQKNKSFSTRLGYQGRYANTIETSIIDYNDGLRHFLLVGFLTKFPLVKNVTFDTKFDLEYNLARSENYIISFEPSINMSVNEWLSVEITDHITYSGLPVRGLKSFDNLLDVALSVRL